MAHAADKFDWGAVYYRGIALGYDNGYAAYRADKAEQRWLRRLQGECPSGTTSELDTKEPNGSSSESPAHSTIESSMSSATPEDKEEWPGQTVVRKAIAEGRVRRCSLCGAEILGCALACVRQGCPMQPTDQPVPQLGGASDGRAADRAEAVGFESLHGVQSVDQPTGDDDHGS